MKWKSRNGFTLIEVLVAINLSFFVLTIAVSFYLFASRFITSFNNKFEKNEYAYNFLCIMDKVLRESGSFQLSIVDKSKIHFMDLKKDLILGNDFILGDFYQLKDITSFEFNIVSDDGSKNFLIKSDSSFADNFPINFSIRSQEINFFQIKFLRDKKVFKYYYSNPPISSARFVNLKD